MPTLIVALVTGLLFGVGLTISQMINPAKVLNFLDLGGIATGNWDPSLAFVMAGALAVTAVGYRLARRRARPLFAPAFQLPTRKDLDARLVTGSILFGIGWGLAGICPGPAISALAFGLPKSVVFVAAMLLGMGGYHLLFERYVTAECRPRQTGRMATTARK